MGANTLVQEKYPNALKCIFIFWSRPNAGVQIYSRSDSTSSNVSHAWSKTFDSTPIISR